MTAADPISQVEQLGLDDPTRYTTGFEAEWLRWSPAEADEHARDGDDRYQRYVDRSCDLTMRGGTTSGVIYPLAVCSLAQHYQFRSVGGASAGAIAAAATAAAEHGRLAAQPTEVPEGSVRPGFAGLAGLINWMISGTGSERWRLVQLFQPNTALSRLYRVVIATMQQPATTGRNRFASVLAALLLAVSPLATVALVLVLAGWLAGPVALPVLLPPPRWEAVPPVVALLAAAAALIAGVWTITLAAARVRKATLVLVIPLVLGIGTLLAVAVAGDAAVSWSAWVTVGAATVLGWLLLSAAGLTAFAVIYTKASWPLIAEAQRFRYGLVPGAWPYTATWVDRLAGMPRSTGVPPLATWLADRIDDLAGSTSDVEPGEDRRALTFGDLWLGSGAERDLAELEACALRSERRMINLALMSTDLSAGRPFRLPFRVARHPSERWQFCERCLDGIVPDRVVRQLKETGPVKGQHCPRHPEAGLHWLPEPWDMPVVLAVRMSLSLPGLICPVPLCREGRMHWFSDGGITSNFPIHFFDTLLPRWPTFGLNLDRLDREVGPEEEIYLAKQDATPFEHPWAKVHDGAASFLSRILETFLAWRDTMQSGLPGFRGRIVSVRQGTGEGGTNLFMPPEVIATLALRGYKAGTELKRRFTVESHDGEAPGYTQTDRYRWIRMRIALREYRELVRQADDRGPLYRQRTARYRIPEGLAGWFDEEIDTWPCPEPHTESIEATFAELSRLAESHLAEKFDGTAPVNPVLRLTPPE
ncbi:patatin-like phospholipase family protein [Amycolatopsis cihanbeyliensis]|uniref:Patatin-like phospholipase n=1 Tax=Amycolatopsis cihanbeyliensis TaxID=1128664 RepID=A0A542DIE2_AMYCI|nr:patatin-like phospholipase family protein [Amycolatopsis cihanbeyliensis]TQJ02816.1 patatin-like phospholipase [Amycolatopsis cihanbeyliensis]